MLPTHVRLALALGVTEVGCGVASECVVGRTCGDARWFDPTAVNEGRQVVAEAVVAASPGVSVDVSRGEAMRLSTRPVYVRFDLASLAGVAGVERAVLSLTPHPSWRPASRAARLRVRGVTSPWSAERVAMGEAPPSGDEGGQATLPAGVRAPLRVDVTPIFRAWSGRAERFEGLSIELDGAEAVFAGPGALDARPRLEVVVR